MQSGCQGCHHCACSWGKYSVHRIGWFYLYLESNAGVVNDAVIVNIEQHEAVHSWMMESVRSYKVQEQLTSIEFHEEHWCDVDGLDVEELHGVDGGDGECGGLFVGVVQLVEMLTFQLN